VQDGQRVGRARLAMHGDHDAAPACQHMKYPAVVRLKTDAAHRAGDTRSRQALIASLKRHDERSAPHRRAKVVDIERLRRTERALDERTQFRRRLPENRQRFNGNPLFPKRFNSRFRPRNILEDTDCETPRFGLDGHRIFTRFFLYSFFLFRFSLLASLLPLCIYDPTRTMPQHCRFYLTRIRAANMRAEKNGFAALDLRAPPLGLGLGQACLDQRRFEIARNMSCGFAKLGGERPCRNDSARSGQSYRNRCENVAA
jgi:hypothetical protein